MLLELSSSLCMVAIPLTLQVWHFIIRLLNCVLSQHLLCKWGSQGNSVFASQYHRAFFTSINSFVCGVDQLICEWDSYSPQHNELCL